MGLASVVHAAGGTAVDLGRIGPHLSAQGPIEQDLDDISRLHEAEIVFPEELMRTPL